MLRVEMMQPSADSVEGGAVFADSRNTSTFGSFKNLNQLLGAVEIYREGHFISVTL